MDTALRALNRFGLGARPGERADISDAREWLRRQLEDDAARLRAPAGSSLEVIGEALRGVRMTATGDERARREARQRVVGIHTAEARAALQQRLTSERPFIERLVAFWSNHLCVSAASKLPVAALAGAYERDVIRPHVLGSFEEMVLASARHPAMLLYLDNAQSIGPSSSAASLAGAARGGNAQRGLNENYARELLELHTLGVNGGYTQQDVTELARVLTGWSVAGLQPERARARPGMRPGRRPLQQRDAGGGAIRFTFDERLHEPGARTVLGARYDEGGVDQGERVIRALCRHPSTAHFVATKLVTHFIADEAPAAAVDHVARVFSETNGDLRAVAMSLVDRPEAWQPELRKFRTPQDWLVAMLRAVVAPQAGDAIGQVLRQLRQPLWSPQSPKGFGDTTVEWADPDSLLNRAEFARTVTRRLMTRNVDARTLLDTIDVASTDPIHTMLTGNSTTAADRVALVFAGPSFQWR